MEETPGGALLILKFYFRKGEDISEVESKTWKTISHFLQLMPSVLAEYTISEKAERRIYEELREGRIDKVADILKDNKIYFSDLHEFANSNIYKEYEDQYCKNQGREARNFTWALQKIYSKMKNSPGADRIYDQILEKLVCGEKTKAMNILSCFAHTPIGILREAFYYFKMGLLGFSIFMGTGLFFLYHVILESEQAIASTEWPSVNGRILRSQIVYVYSESDTSRPFHPGQGGGSAPSWSHLSPNADIAYAYQVNGQDYRSEKISFMFIDIDETVANYRTGSTVKVFYDPLNPSIAVLEPGYGITPANVITFGSFAIAVLLVFPLGYILRRYRND